jgi:hypothetical protein
MTAETPRQLVREAEIDDRRRLDAPTPRRPDATSAEAELIKVLGRENPELRWANEILKAPSAFFTGELDPRAPNRSGRSSNAHGDRFRAKPSCRALQIGPPGYWAANRRRQRPAAGALGDERLLAGIRRVHELSRGLCGGLLCQNTPRGGARLIDAADAPCPGREHEAIPAGRAHHHTPVVDRRLSVNLLYLGTARSATARDGVLRGPCGSDARSLLWCVVVLDRSSQKVHASLSPRPESVTCRTQLSAESS